MQVRVTVSDDRKFNILHIVMDCKSVSGDIPTFTGLVKGIPSFWTLTYFQTLLSRELGKQGLRGVKCQITKQDGIRYSVRVTFTAPNLVPKSRQVPKLLLPKCSKTPQHSKALA